MYTEGFNVPYLDTPTYHLSRPHQMPNVMFLKSDFLHLKHTRLLSPRGEYFPSHLFRQHRGLSVTVLFRVGSFVVY